MFRGPMNFKALSFGAVLGFLVAVVPSCGGPVCAPQNCNGCCDSANKCVPSSASNSNTACGNNGTTCANCAVQNQVCNTTSFVCEFGAGQGGGTGGGSAGGTGGGSTGGGTGGGTTGGGTGGGAVGGGSGGGTGGAGGGATGGGSGTACSVASQNCPTGQSCMFKGDQSSVCFAGACDVVTQNCATATDKCTYVQGASGPVRGCRPAGAVAEGMACTPADECAKGLLCVNATCVKFCYQTSNCTGSGQCISGVTITGTEEVPTTCVTLAACDPLLQNCPTGQGCYLAGSGPACVSAGNTANGAACTSGNACVRGSICLGSPPTATCHGYCNLDGGTPNCATTGQCGGVTNGQGVPQPFGACQ